MKSMHLPLLACLLASCSQEATSQQQNLSPQSSSFVVTGTYSKFDNLSQRLSLVMDPSDIQLYKISGTSILDMYALAVNGKTFKKNGYTHIDQKDFMAIKTVEVGNDTLNLVLYDSGEKIGQLNTNVYGDWYLSELCTGTTESLCTFNWDEINKGFSFTFLPQLDPTEGPAVEN